MPIALTHSFRRVRYYPKRPITFRQFQDDHDRIAALTWRQDLGRQKSQSLITPRPVGANITLKPQPAAMEGFRAISVLVAMDLLPWQRVGVVSLRALQGSNPSPHLEVADLVGAFAA